MIVERGQKWSWWLSWSSWWTWWSCWSWWSWSSWRSFEGNESRAVGCSNTRTSMLDLNNMSIVNRVYEYGNAANDGDSNNDTGSKRNCDESDDHRFVRDGKLSKIMSNHLRLHFNLCKLLSGTQKLNQDASNDANCQPLPPAQIQILPFPTCSPIKSSLVQFMPSSTIA